jgi:hypothetical protein
MADKLPEHGRKESIKPTAAPVGFAQAAQGSMHASQIYGGIAAGIASDASKTRSTLAGQELGKTPGQKLAPPITMADKDFHEAYVNQSSTVLSIEADRLMNKLSFEFGQNPMPTGDDLAKFDQQATAGLSELLELADPRAKQGMKNAFTQKFDSDMLSMADKVEDSNRKKYLQNFNSSTQANLENIQNYNMKGMRQAAQDAYEQQVKNLESARALIGEDKYTQGLQAAQTILDSSVHEQRMMQLYETGGEEAAAKYIQDFYTHPQAGLNDTDKSVIGPQLYNRYAKQLQVDSMVDSLNLSRAQVEMKASPNGALDQSRMGHYAENLTEGAFNQLQLAQMAALKESTQASAYGAFMNANAGNKIALDSMEKEKSGSLDKGYRSNLQQIAMDKGSPATFDDETNLARTYDTNVGAYTQKLQSGINSKNPEVAAQMANTYSMLARENPNVVSGVDSASAQKAEKITKFMEGQLSPAEAVESANDQFDNMSKMEVKERQELFKEQVRLNDYKSPSDQIAKLAKKMNWNKDWIVPGMTSTFMSLAENNFMTSGDLTEATDLAAAQVAQLYTRTDVNGFDETMYLSPSQYVDAKFVQENILKQATDVFEAQFQDFEYNSDSNAMFRYEFVDKDKAYQRSGLPTPKELEQFGKTPELGLGLALDAGPVGLRVRRIDRDGNTVEGMFLVQPDKDTAFPLPGETPSYAMKFKADDRRSASLIYNPENFSSVRFALSEADIKKYSEEQQSAAMQRQKLMDQHAIDSMEMRRKITELRLDLGEDLYYDGN